MIADSFIPSDRLALIERHAKYDDENQRWVIPFLEKAGRHQKVEEVEEQAVFIQGIEGPMTLSRQPPPPPTPTIDVKRAAQAQKKRKMAAKHALNEFALVSDIVAQRPK
jgi:hypothetical protein